jgi:TonB-linked SusC/RagA family outer membrane protein
MKTIYKKLLFLFLLLPFSVLAQNAVSGVVLDKTSGQPLPGVNVVIQGSAQGTSTDFDGKFKLSNLKKGDKIGFSFIGYKTQTVDFSNQSTVNISLEEDSNQLQEVVVQVGYGTVKKKDATGSVTTVTTKDFNKGANVTAENLLNGRVAGLTINTSGAPGSGSQIRIRGGASLSASNDPLIVIDGLPIDNSTSTGSTSILASINPATIESITVLKDASATAIYGSRASNGVIIITTKKGGKQLEVDYNFQLGIGKSTGQVDVFSANEYRDLVNANRPELANLLGNSNTNWQDAIYKTAEMVDQSVSLKGNFLNTIPTRLTFGRTYQEGLRLTNEFRRNSVSLAMNPSFLDSHLKLKLNANYANEKNRFADGVEGSALRFDPTQPIYDAANTAYGGFFQYSNPDGTPQPNSGSNPVAQLLQTQDNGLSDRIFGNFEIDYKLHFFPDLRAVVNLGYDHGEGTRRRTVDNNSRSAYIGNTRYGVSTYSNEVKTNKLFDGYLVYNKTISNLKLEATGGYSYQKFERERYETFNQLNPGEQDPDTTKYGDVVLVSFFGRTNLNFYDKYLLTLTYRRDGTSRFSEANRWGNFPSAAFAWKIKDESFMKNSKLFSDLKLRLGWGVTGQQDLGDSANFLYLEPYSIGSNISQYVFGPTPTPVAIPTFRNVDIKWEETTTYNAGLDYGFFKNRVTGSVELFYKKTKDLLSYAAISDGSNFSNAGFQNIGDLSTKGVEFTLNADVYKSDNFNWNVNFNASKFERRIDKLALGADILTGGIGGGTGGTIQIQSEGYTPNSFYVFKQLYDVDNNPIQGAYADLNGDGIVNDKDRYIKYNSDPDFTLGFASTMNYKNLDFSFNLRASIGNHNYNNINSVSAYYSQIQGGTVLSNVPTAILDTNFTEAGSLGTQSDIYVEDASFLRMDNITLGYTFPKWLDGKASLRLSTGIQNVFVITNYSGLDPEITNNGIDDTIYPRQRTVLFGANIKF